MSKIQIMSFDFDTDEAVVEMHLNEELKKFDPATQVDILGDIFCEFGTIQRMFVESYIQMMEKEEKN